MDAALQARLAATLDAALTSDALQHALRCAQAARRMHARSSYNGDITGEASSHVSDLEMAVQLLRRKIVAEFLVAGHMSQVPDDAALLPWDNDEVIVALALRDYAIFPLRMPTAVAQVAPGRAACARLACPHCRRPLTLDLRLEHAAARGWCESDLVASSMLAAATASRPAGAEGAGVACTASDSLPDGGPATDRLVYWAHRFLACARRSGRGQVERSSLNCGTNSKCGL